MKLMLIELHGMDISSVENMPFLHRLGLPKVFDTYTGLGSTVALWTGIGELANGGYHRHMWNGTSAFLDNKVLRLLRGDLYFVRSDQPKFRLTRTKHFFQDCLLFKEMDFCYSERPIIATNKRVFIDLAKDEVKRIKKFQRLCSATLNFIRLPKIDKLGHIFGPRSIEVKNYARQLDAAIENIYDTFDGEVIVFSLYGMLEPKKKIDVMSYLCSLKDLIFFVDDENIRIWNNGKSQSIEKAISHIDNLNCGFWLKDKPDRKFGDYFYKAFEGVAFVPNNYVKYDIKGIHSPKGWMISNCGTVNHITEFKDLILNVCSKNAPKK